MSLEKSMLSTFVASFVFLYLMLCKPDIYKMKDYDFKVTLRVALCAIFI